MNNIIKVLVSLCLLACSVANAKPLTTVDLQLKWRHQFQFAGYYAAKEKGFYEELGLEVVIHEAQPGVDPIEQVVHGKAHFGVGTSELIMDRQEGSDVVVLGVVFQHSPLNLITLASSGIDTIHKLAGKEVMIEHSSAELFAYLRCEGFTKKAINIREHSFDTKDLLNNNVQAMSVYVTDEPFELDRMGIAYNLYTPRMCGIDFYGDNFFTMQATIEKTPKLVEAFRQATIKGWAYAMNNVDEMIQIIHHKYSDRHSLEHLRYEARMMVELIQPSLIEPGYMNPGRWKHIAATYHDLGLVSKDFDVTDMLYHDPKAFEIKKLKYVIVTAGSILIASLLILFTIGYFYRQAKVSSSRFQTMFDNAPFTMAILDKDLKVLVWNQQAEKTFLWKQEEVMGKDLVQTIVPKFMQAEISEKLKRVVQEKVAFRSENANFRKNGEEIICEWINAPFHDQHSSQEYIVAMARDVTARKRLEGELEKAAHYDGLTALANRRLILDLFRGAIANAQRSDGMLGVLFIDLNNFKKINDEYGHGMGDQVLKLVADRLKLAVRESDYVGRLAGDEFLIVLQNIGSRADADAVAEKIDTLIVEPCHIEDSLINISVSIGISIYPEDSTDLEELISKSDKRMYIQKAERKSQPGE